MPSIALVRVVHLLAYLEVLRGVGAPVERELRRARLPTLLDELPNAYVSAVPALRFLDAIARSEAMEDLGLLATSRGSFRRLRPDLQASIRSAPTLWARLRRLGELAAAENSKLRLSFVPEGAATRLCLGMLDMSNMPGLEYSEWLQLDTLVDIIRDAVGQDWSPFEITFQSRVSLPRSAFERFPHARLRMGCEQTSLVVSSALLTELYPADPDRTTADGKEAGLVVATEIAQLDFSRVLKLALRPYLGEGYPDIHLAAEIAGVSPRALQRQLMRCGLSYRTLIRETRVEAAAELLASCDTSVLEAAYSVGYADPSNFSRAFRGVTGANPRRNARTRS